MIRGGGSRIGIRVVGAAALIALAGIACSESVTPVQPDPDPDPGPLRWVKTSLGAEHTCGLTSEGDVFCWGSNARRQLTSDDVLSLDLPTKVWEAAGSIDVEAGGSGVCATDPGGERLCWGMNWQGQLGVAGDTVLTVPTQVEGPTFRQVALGEIHSCGVDESGTVFCWGGGGPQHGRFYALGSPMTGTCPELSFYYSTDCSPTPLAVSLPEAAVEAGTGVFYSCALGVSGVVYCWGSYRFGSLGDGTERVNPPEAGGRYEAVAVSGEHTFSDLSVGNTYACAVDDTGAAFCWGHDQTPHPRGRLGTGYEEGEGGRVPLPVAGGLQFEQVATAKGNSADAGHTCGRTVDDELYCWGSDEFGQLGVQQADSICHIDSPCELAPKAVVGGLSFVQVDVGLNHTCGITGSGDLYCWGRNELGQLGLGDRADRSVPAQVAIPE